MGSVEGSDPTLTLRVAWLSFAIAGLLLCTLSSPTPAEAQTSPKLPALDGVRLEATYAAVKRAVGGRLEIKTLTRAPLRRVRVRSFSTHMTVALVSGAGQSAGHLHAASIRTMRQQAHFGSLRVGMAEAKARRLLSKSDCTPAQCWSRRTGYDAIVRFKRKRAVSIQIVTTEVPVARSIVEKAAAATLKLPAGTRAGTTSTVVVPGGSIVRVRQSAGTLRVFGASATVSIAPDGTAEPIASSFTSSVSQSAASRADLADVVKQLAAQDLGRPAATIVLHDRGSRLYDPALFGQSGQARGVRMFDAVTEDDGETLLVTPADGEVLLQLPHRVESQTLICDAGKASFQRCGGSGLKPVRSGPQAIDGQDDVNVAFEGVQVYRRFLEARAPGAGFARRDLAITTGTNLDNARWRFIDDQVEFGTGWALPDQVWHELTHGLGETLVKGDDCYGLCYVGESGAINESMSDVFAALVEQTPRIGAPTGQPWRYGENLPGRSDGIRDLANPGMSLGGQRGKQPETMDGYVSGGGVHQNSGIANKTAYLITVGTQAEKFNDVTVRGLGVEKTTQIYVRTYAGLPEAASLRVLGLGLYRACVALIGQYSISSSDCYEVGAATSATRIAPNPSTTPDQIAGMTGQGLLPNRLARARGTGTSYLVDSAGKPHWIRDAATYNCLATRGVVQIDVRQAEIDKAGDGKPWQPACNQIVRVSDTGTSYFLDGAGAPHWIDSEETYNCLTARGVASAEITQPQVDALGNGKPHQASCRNKILRVGSTGTTYFLDGSGKPHWIRDGGTFNCYRARFDLLETTQSFVDSLGDGKPWAPQCNSIATVSATGTSYFLDGSGQPHWIADAETYHCLTAQGHAVTEGLPQTLIDALGNGQPWQPRCLDRDRVKRKILRVPSNGTTYFVDDAGRPHWISTGAIFNCLKDRGIPVVDGLEQQHVDSIGNGQPWQPSCSSILTVSATGTSFFLDGAGYPHWIPDAETYHCLTARGHSVAADLPQVLVDALGNGQPWQGRCIDPARARGRILSVSNGPSYIYDGSLRWIPGTETYYCWKDTHGWSPITGLTQEQVDTLGNGQPWAPECISPPRVRTHVVREKGGTAYYVDGSDIWHWIPDGGVYNCLVAKHPLTNNVTWGEIDSVRRENGVHANCSM